MKFVFLSHSVVSDWNHGNAHFQRGIMRTLVARGHEAVAWEPVDGWSRSNLIAEQGLQALKAFSNTFPDLTVRLYDKNTGLDAILSGADVVVVHEWTDSALIAAIGRRRAAGARFTLLFHDTHHRAVSADVQMADLDLDGYDGVLAFGEALSAVYRKRGWGRRVFTWHEAADTTVFHPDPGITPHRDLIWIGNWGDGERDDTLRTFLVEPVRTLGLDATLHGVRYPTAVTRELAEAGFSCRGWLANADVPRAFAEHRVTVHVPRAPYAASLPGIPTIRVFEALACGIPLVTAPWLDVEGLFRPGQDFLVADSGDEMRRQLRRVIEDADLAESMRISGLEQILSRHTCGHRVDELFAILEQIGAVPAALEHEQRKMVS